MTKRSVALFTAISLAFLVSINGVEARCLSGPVEGSASGYAYKNGFPDLHDAEIKACRSAQLDWAARAIIQAQSEELPVSDYPDLHKAKARAWHSTENWADGMNCDIEAIPCWDIP